MQVMCSKTSRYHALYLPEASVFLDLTWRDYICASSCLSTPQPLRGASAARLSPLYSCSEDGTGKSSDYIAILVTLVGTFQEGLLQ